MTAPDVSSVPTWYLERAINDTLPGLQNLVRDVWLAPSQAVRYEVGSILRNPRPVDATSRVGGMRTSHRFAILSNHAYDLSGLDEADRGLHSMAAPFGSTFQVVDVFEHAGKTQITLLHLPDDERWRLFDGVALSAVNDLIPGVRERFRAKCLQEPIPEVSSDEWLTRMHDPVGLDGRGEPYAADIPISERFRLLSETERQDISGHLLYVRGAGELMRLDGVRDCLCWGRTDHEHGLCLDLLCDASLDGDSVTCGRALSDVWVHLEYGVSTHLEAAEVCGEPLAELRGRLDALHEMHVEEERYRGLREVGFLDGFRYLEYPDDVRALMYSDDKGSEEVRLRLEELEKTDKGTYVYAKLLTEPKQDYSVHAGDLLSLAFTDTEDGTVCLAIPEKVG